MKIVADERTERFSVMKCDNCGAARPGRRIRTYGAMGESRGMMAFCFDCFGPRIVWERGGRLYESPAAWPPGAGHEDV